jgi:hypothetical protein
MKTYPIIPCTSILKREVVERYAIFGTGNEKRDLVLLVRGDLDVERVVCVSFFGCIHCGYMATGTVGFERMDGRVVCKECGSEGMVYYFDGIWKGVMVRVVEGVRDSKITVSKM